MHTHTGSHSTPTQRLTHAHTHTHTLTQLGSRNCLVSFLIPGHFPETLDSALSLCPAPFNPHPSQ